VPTLIDRLTAARRRHTAALAELEEAKTELRESAAEIEECLLELETGEPARPLLDAIEERAALPPGPRGETDFHGRRQRAKRPRETADRLVKPPDPWEGHDEVRYAPTRSAAPEPPIVVETSPAGPVVARKGVFPARSTEDAPAPITAPKAAQAVLLPAALDDRRVPKPIEGWSDLRLLNALARMGDDVPAVLCNRCEWLRASAALPCPNCKGRDWRLARAEVGKGQRRKPK
jgi:hypothetical protein